LKIGPHLPKLLSNIKWLTFLRHSVYYLMVVLVGVANGSTATYIQQN